LLSESLFGGSVHLLDLFVERSFVGQISPFLPRRLVRQGAMRPLVVIVVLPLPELFIEVWSGEIDRRVKLFPFGFLTPLHFPIEMRRPRLDRAKLDHVVHQPLLEFVREELHPTVGLDALDREGQRFNHVAKEIERVLKPSASPCSLPSPCKVTKLNAP
jgi:hypothetical protein